MGDWNYTTLFFMYPSLFLILLFTSPCFFFALSHENPQVSIASVPSHTRDHFFNESKNGTGLTTVSDTTFAVKKNITLGSNGKNKDLLLLSFPLQYLNYISFVFGVKILMVPFSSVILTFVFQVTNKTINEEDLLTTLDWFQLFCFVYNLQLHEMSYSWRIEKGLARARRSIKEAARSRSCRSNTEDEFVPRGSIYINPYAFHQLRFSPYFIHLMISLCHWLGSVT